MEVVSFKVQIWKTFGLSQPSLKAEWENMNFNLVSKLKSLSLSFMIKLNVDSSSLFALNFPALVSLVSLTFPFLSTEK